MNKKKQIIKCADKIDRYEYILSMDDLSVIERKYWRQQYSFYKWYLNVILGVDYKNE